MTHFVGLQNRGRKGLWGGLRKSVQFDHPSQMTHLGHLGGRRPSSAFQIRNAAETRFHGDSGLRRNGVSAVTTAPLGGGVLFDHPFETRCAATCEGSGVR